MFTTKLTVTSTKGVSLEESTFNNSTSAVLYPDALGTKINLDSEEYIFVGFKAGARTKKALIENKNGERFRVQFDDIKEQLSTQTK